MRAGRRFIFGTSRWIAVGVIAVVLSALPALASAQGGHRTRCGKVAVPVRHLDAKVLVLKGPGACPIARTVIKAAFTAEAQRHHDFLDPVLGIGWRVDGWRCTTGLAGSQTFCKRGGDRIDGSFRTDDGWNF
jgi:hypothetical protein